MLESCYKQLKYSNYAYLKFDNANILVIELFHIPIHPNIIHDYDVPMLLLDKISIAGLPWDITIQHLLSFINNEHHVKTIAKNADMDIDCVRRCLQILIFYKCILITDIFHFSNIYIPRPLVTLLLDGYIYIYDDIQIQLQTNTNSNSNDNTNTNYPNTATNTITNPNITVSIKLINEILGYSCIRLESLSNPNPDPDPVTMETGHTGHTGRTEHTGRTVQSDGELKFPIELVHDLVHVLFLFHHSVCVRDVVIKCYTNVIEGVPYN